VGGNPESRSKDLEFRREAGIRKPGTRSLGASLVSCVFCLLNCRFQRLASGRSARSLSSERLVDAPERPIEVVLGMSQTEEAGFELGGGEVNSVIETEPEGGLEGS
jgi:hypothetical protein